MKSNNLTSDVRRVEHQTPEIKINRNEYFNNASEDDIKLYFSSQFINNYKVEEKEFKKLIDTDEQYHDKDKHVKLPIYYKNRKAKNLFIKNKTTNNKTTLLENYNVIYVNTHARRHVMWRTCFKLVIRKLYCNRKNQTTLFSQTTLC